MVSDVYSKTLDIVERVLILVLMEYGLGQRVARVVRELMQSLNPCFNGIWSRTLRTYIVMITS